MNIKEKYYSTLENNKGRLDEITLGETMGLDENQTRKLINELLVEFKIEFDAIGLSNYRIMKKKHVNTFKTVKR